MTKVFLGTIMISIAPFSVVTAETIAIDLKTKVLSSSLLHHCISTLPQPPSEDRVLHVAENGSLFAIQITVIGFIIIGLFVFIIIIMIIMIIMIMVMVMIMIMIMIITSITYSGKVNHHSQCVLHNYPIELAS
jgi:hypothetical protein